MVLGLNRKSLVSFLAAFCLAGCGLIAPGAPSPTGLPAAPAAAPTQTALPFPSPAASPTAFVLTGTPLTGPPQLEQALWLANPSDGNLLVIDTQDDSLAVIIPTGLKPERVVTGEGAAWAIDPSSSALIEVDLHTYAIRQVIHLAQYDLTALAVGLGSVWLGVSERSTPVILNPNQEFTPRGGVLRIDPASGKTTGYAQTGPVNALAASPNGLWALLQGQADTPIARIAPDTLKVQMIALSGTSDWLLEDALAAGSDGLWLYSSGFGKLYHANFQGGLYGLAVLGQHKPLGSAALLETSGSLWLAAPWGSLLRFDPASGKQTAEIQLNQALDLLQESGGALWATSLSMAFAYRIDPQTNRVTARVALGSPVAFKPRSTPTAVQRATHPCEEGPYSRLAVGMRAVTPGKPALPNRLHKEPGMVSEVSGYIQPGQHVKILEGPDCTDYWNWWRVTVEESGASGWAAEGNETEIWLFPVKEEPTPAK